MSLWFVEKNQRVVATGGGGVPRLFAAQDRRGSRQMPAGLGA